MSKGNATTVVIRRDPPDQHKAEIAAMLPILWKLNLAHDGATLDQDQVVVLRRYLARITNA